jgi:formamidopyrimidine-DNA glycosylase
MPELPEVEIVRQGLQQYVAGKVIKSIKSDWAKSLPVSNTDINQYIVGSTILSVDRRAKLLLINLSSQHTLMVHLKMTGQLVFVSRSEHFGAGHPNDSLIGQLPDKSTRVIVTFADGSHLYFNDQRKFGWIKLEQTEGIADRVEFLRKLGPEPVGEQYNFADFRVALQRRARTSIKAAILDQSVISGVGNIYADEALFAARIHPATKVADVSTIKLKRLFIALREVMLLSIRHGGSSDRNYVNAKGEKGSYLRFAKVFRREGQPCPECGGQVVKIRVAGRGTHICPACQKLPKEGK